MKRLISVFSCIFLVLGAVSCQKPAFITAPDSLSFTVDGASQTISITVNRDWRISSSESWCTLTPNSGLSSDEPVSVTVKCQPNTSYDERTATVTIQADEISHRIQIVQAQRDAILSDSQLLRADYQAQDLLVPAEANVDFTVTVLKGDDWIRPMETKGMVQKQVRIHLDENRSGAVREGAVSLTKSPAAFTFQVRQAPWHAVLEHTEPGFYGLKEKEFAYQPGVSQISRGKVGTASFFRILTVDPPEVLSVEGIPGEMTLTESFPLKVRLVSGEEGVLYEKAGSSTVLRETDSQVWLQLSGNAGIIVKK